MACEHNYYVDDSKGPRCYHCGKPFLNWVSWKYGPLWFWADGEYSSDY